MSDEMGKIYRGEKRFGVVAVEKGLITRDQLFEALKAQVDQELENGIHQLFGEILCEQGAMTWAQVGEVLQTLGVLQDVFEP